MTKLLADLAKALEWQRHDVEPYKSALQKAEVERDGLRIALTSYKLERDALLVDAERYRWLRRYHSFDLLQAAWQHSAATHVGADCDAAIDAARKEKP